LHVVNRIDHDHRDVGGSAEHGVVHR
jgi:hypothetical protein